MNPLAKDDCPAGAPNVNVMSAFAARELPYICAWQYSDHTLYCVGVNYAYYGSFASATVFTQRVGPTLGGVLFATEKTIPLNDQTYDDSCGNTVASGHPRIQPAWANMGIYELCFNSWNYPGFSGSRTFSANAARQQQVSCTAWCSRKALYPSLPNNPFCPAC
jgi:hypothetical protein